MKTQAQFYNQENATEYWEQYFTTQTSTPITIEQWFEIKRIIDDVTDFLCLGHEVEVKVTTKVKNEEE